MLNVGLGIPELIGEEAVDACVMLMIELRGVVLLVVVESIESRFSLLGASDPMVMIDDVEILRSALMERAEESSCSGVCGSNSTVHLHRIVSITFRRRCSPVSVGW